MNERAAVKMMPEDLKRRVREYRNDQIIEHYRKIIERIISYAEPHIIVYANNPSKSIFDIDEESKNKIEYFKGELEKYVEQNYSDILHR